MKNKLRVARGTNDLKRLSAMYQAGLDLKIIGSFYEHEGFDGVMLGLPDCDYHLEFTQEQGVVAPFSHSSECLLVFYCSSKSEFEMRTTAMNRAGFKRVQSHNPYWERNGATFEDFENYRVVISHQ